MKTFTNLRRTTLRLALVALPALVAVPTETPANAAGPPRKGIEPQADHVLREMTDYLAGLRSFTVRSSAIDEVVLKSGQKVQVATESRVAVERPNRLRSEQVGPVNGAAFWYQGKTMTLYCRATHTYGTAPRRRRSTRPSVLPARSSR